MAGAKAHLCRAGLIGGPGDGTDRYGYWPARFSRDGGPVLVPDIGGSATQIIDVRDLAAWILKAAGLGITGALNAVGERRPVRGLRWRKSRRLARLRRPDVSRCRRTGWSHRASRTGRARTRCPCGFRRATTALPHASNAAAVAAGLTFRPWQETLRDTLDDERHRGLDRERKAGLSAATEKRLVAEFQAVGGP